MNINKVIFLQCQEEKTLEKRDITLKGFCIEGSSDIDFADTSIPLIFRRLTTRKTRNLSPPTIG